ncbi:aminotransferase [Cunninghamella echinulata]|nr:aminotransferase [Cunninghamella echinulata]
MESFSLLETILYDPTEGFYLLEGHLKRLTKATEEFKSFPKPNIETITQQLNANLSDTPQRVRLLYNSEGKIKIEYTPLLTINSIDTLDQVTHDMQPILKVALDTQPTDTKTKFVLHKTTHRSIYNDARERVHAGANNNNDSIFDVILWNKNHQVTETSISNIAIGTMTHDGTFEWKTPSLDCGLLPGVFRQHLLNKGQLIESKITTDDLIKSQETGDLIDMYADLI